jgi:hypothetical protein
MYRGLPPLSAVTALVIPKTINTPSIDIIARIIIPIIFPENLGKKILRSHIPL